VALEGLRLADRGVSRSGPVLLSVILTALVVAWFASGVLRGRRVRAGIVAVLLVLGVLLQIAGIVSGTVEPGSLLQLAVAVVQLGALRAVCRSGYFRAQQLPAACRRPAGPEIGALLALAVVAGALGGLTAPPGDDVRPQLRIGL
jgi:hypothetical protein